MAHEVLVSLENISLFLPGELPRRLLFQALNLKIHAQEHSALIGANGAGKSTLLRLLAGEIWPCAGKILWRDGAGYSESPIAGRALTALVEPQMQERIQYLAPAINVENFLRQNLDGQKSPAERADCESDLDQLCRRLKLNHLLCAPLARLSQGQMRILLLAKALLRRPELLLLDECSDGLDKDTRRRFFDLLDEVKESLSIIMVSHQSQNLPSWCTQTLYLEMGRLRIFPTLQAARCSYPLFGSDSGLTIHSKVCPCQEIQKIRLRPAQGNPETARDSQTRPVFDLKNVSVYRERQLILKNLEWRVYPGENWRLCGANGSGKSTLLRLLAGDEFAACGGHFERFLPSLGREPDSLEELRKKVRLISDLGQALYDYPLSALELLLSGLDGTVGLYREYNSHERERCLAWLEKFFPDDDVRVFANSSIRRLSSGQLRRLFLARALVSCPSTKENAQFLSEGPDVLLLDEACSALDAASRRSYLELIETLTDSSGAKALGLIRPVQIIFVSHEKDDAPAFISKAAVLENGFLRQER